MKQEVLEQKIEVKKESIGTIPSGTIEINENGLYEVSDYANANVLTSGIIPSGTYNIDSNGLYDITTYENVNVSVPGISEIQDGSYLFSYNARLDTMNTLLPILKHPTNLEALFFNSGNLTEIDVSNLDTSNATSMKFMFSQCGKLRTITGLENFNTSNVTNMQDMFSGIGSGLFQYRQDIYNIDLSSWDLSNTTSINGMFQDLYRYAKEIHLDLSSWDLSKCYELYDTFAYSNGTGELTIDFTNWDTHTITSLSGTFEYNTMIKELDLSSLYMPNLRNTGNTFCGCTNLRRIDMRNMNFTNATYYGDMFYDVPDDCLIIVADNTQKQWILDRFSNLTNVKTINEL